jgi:ribonucleoside-diphosphate reductase alpha chain
MSDQQTTSQKAQNAGAPDTDHITQLEGIRQKVFIDRYSLKDAAGQPLEHHPEQLWARVARGIAEVEKTPEARAEWEKKFFHALSDFQFVPGGRILAGAGSGHQVTYYNCMPPDQEVLTADGYRPISEIKIGDLVVTHRNRLRPVLHKFERETEEPLYIIRPKKMGYDDLRVTGDHKVYIVRSEWVNKHKSRDGLRLQHEPDWIAAKDIKAGDYVAIAYNGEECLPDTIYLQDYISGYETKDGKLFKATTRGDHGYVSDWGTHYKIQDHLVLDEELCYLFGRWLGDGCVTHRTGTDIPSGIKIVFSLNEKKEAEEIAQIIEAKFDIKGSIKLSSTERWYDLWVNSMPMGEFFKAFLGCYSYGKQIPDQLMHLPEDLTLELLRGLFSADGYLSGNKLGIVLANRTLTVQTHQLLLRMGYLFSIRENTHRLGRVPAYRVQATANECAPLFERFFGVQAPAYETDLKYYFEYDNLKWVRIDEIGVEDYTGTVLDIEVEEDHSFISAGIVASNCFVIPSPEDSRQGILDNLKVMTEIMARGGGVGINLSTLRPRGSYIRTVNGTASGPCSWAQLYSVATGDVIQQGGCFGPDERIATDHGLIPVKELVTRLENGEKIQAQTHKGWRPFSHIFRNGTKDLYEVTTSRGYSVRVTLDHKMGVLRDGEIVTIPLRDLKEGNKILLLFGEGTKAEVYPDPISSISLIGPSEVFDFEVDDVHMLVANGIYSSNSRRGALMLMLDDNHPDVEEFITVKRTAGKIEHANLSVCISDNFMQAVKDDANWDLIWQGEVKKTIRARGLWDLICTSAWESAEPGMVFMDRYNKLSNTWYYENIRCVNPCVTGDTLVSTEHGYTRACDLQVGMKVRTPAGLKPIEKLYNNGLQRIYRVDFSDGGHLKATADHKLKVVRSKKYEWVPLAELRMGDRVLVSPNEAFGTRQNLPSDATDYINKEDLHTADFYDRQFGLIVGSVLVDGTLHELTDDKCEIAFDALKDGWYDKFTNLMAEMHIQTQLRLVEREHAGKGGVMVKHATVRLECSKLIALLVHMGMTPKQKTIPAAFMSMDKEFLAGILDGLFSMKGSVLMKQDSPMLRLYTSYELAQQIRLLLLQFGIHGRIYRATNTEELMYDGYPIYSTSEKYHITISNEGIPRFYAEIGLSHPEKAARLKDLAENWHYIGGTWTASVVSVTDTESEEEVYDLYEPNTLTWITNGYCSLDCGEQGLGVWGVCNLGAMNLSSFVHNGQFDYERLAEQTKVAMRFLDNVIDSTEYFIQENAEAQLGTRRTGLGTMGLADALIKMQIAYGSDESVPVIEKIYTTIRDAAYEASADYAAEKGAFPRFERDKYMQGHFIKQLPKPLQEKIKKQGTRNAVLLTQAPTGTTSLLAGVSSGIEPVYDFAMIRRDRTGEHILYHPLLQAWRDEHPNEATPGYFVSSKDLTPEEHVRVQATIQKYTDSSISKTVNAPNEHTVEQVQKLYRLAYEMGCKGITYYRDGSRDAVLTRIEDEKKKKSEQKPTEEQALMIEPVTSIQQGIKPRPAVVSGYTRQVNAPEGKINVTINSDEHGPLEVFVNVGKAGSDIAALAEALGRLISLNLRVLSPLSQVDRAKEIAEQLRGIGGSRSVGFGMQQVRSLPDAVARALELHMESQQQESEQQAQAKSDTHNGHTNGASANANPLSLNQLSVTGNLCTECGCNTLVFEEGCKKCYSCGHSEC